MKQSKYIIAALLGILTCIICRWFNSSDFMAGAATMIVYFNTVEIIGKIKLSRV